MAQLSMTGTPVTVDFSTTVTNVNNGAFNRASGNAISASTPASGQLDADAWSFVTDNFQALNLRTPFATPNVGSGNLTIADSSTFTGTNNSGIASCIRNGNRMVYVGPTQGQFSSGAITLRLINGLATACTRIRVSYEVRFYNDQNRAIRSGFMHAPDSTNFTEIPSMEARSGLTAAAGLARWEYQSRVMDIYPAEALAAGGDYFLRWFIDDLDAALGTTDRDEFYLDNITVTAFNDARPAVSLTASASSVNEAAAPVVTLTATLSAPASANDTIRVAVSGESITSGDFSLTQPFIVIPSGNTTGTTTIQILNDDLNDLTDTLIVTLDSVYRGTSADLIIGSTQRVSIIINDDDDALSLTAMESPLSAANFDNMPAQFGGNLRFDFPKGFYLNETGANANQWPPSYSGGLNTNTSFSGDAFILGSPLSTDRAIGSGCSGSLEATYGFKLVNNTGIPITQLKIGYTLEQWRDMNAADSLAVQISTNATSFTDPLATWVPLINLGKPSPVSTATLNTQAFVLDGNNAANRTVVLDSIFGSTLSAIPNGTTFYIRWQDLNSVSNDDVLGIDDVVITAQQYIPTIYYSKATGALNDTATWGSNYDGTGTTPISFNLNNAIFNIRNRAGSPIVIDYPWTVGGSNSRINVGDSILAYELVLDSALTTVGSARMDVNPNATVRFKNAVMPGLNLISTSSTLAYEQTTGTVTIPANAYGNIELRNGQKNFGTGSVAIQGNLTMENTTTQAAGAPFTTLTVNGNITYLGTVTTSTVTTGWTMFLGGSANQTIDLNGNLLYVFRFQTDAKTAGNVTLAAPSGPADSSNIQANDDFRLRSTSPAVFTDNGNRLICLGDFNADGNSAGYNLTGTVVMRGTSGTQQVRKADTGAGQTELIVCQFNNLHITTSGTAGVTFQPTSGSANVNLQGDLLINHTGSGSINLGSSKVIAVNGNITTNGSTLSGTNAQIRLLGSTPQSVTRTGSLSQANTVWPGLRIDNPTTVTFSGMDTLEMVGNVLVQAGTLNTNNQMLIRSASQLMHGTGTPFGGGNVNGTVMVVRNSNNTNLTQANLWSSPVANGKLSEIGGLDHNMFVATTQTWQVQGIGNPTTNAMPVGRGYSVYGGGDANFRGNLNDGTITTGIVQNASSTDWNLVGNPYPSGLLLDSVISALQNPNITGSVYIWNRTLTDYVTLNSLNAGYVIPSAQGFFVEATATGSINFNNVMRQANTGTFLRTQSSIPAVKLEITGNQQLNETKIAFAPNASNGFDHALDARKLKGNPKLALYSQSANDDLSILALPTLTGAVSVPLGLDAHAGTYTLSLAENTLDPAVNVFLEDNGTMHNLKLAPYTIQLGSNSVLRNRFVVHFQPLTTSVVPVENAVAPIVFAANGTLSVRFAGAPVSRKLEIVDLNGRVLKTVATELVSETSIDLNDMAQSVYLLRATENGHTSVTKFILAR